MEDWAEICRLHRSEGTVNGGMAARVRTEPSKRAAGTFRSPADDMHRATVYLPRATVRGLKQAAFDGDTSMSKIPTDLADRWLADNTKTLSVAMKKSPLVAR